MMRKKKKSGRMHLLGMVLALVVTAGLLLAGCSSEASQKSAEYKELGISQMSSGDYEGAAKSFQKALDQSGGRIGAEEMDLCYYKAMALYLSGDSEGAISVYDALLEYKKKNWEVYYLRGTMYLWEGDQEAALADYATAVSYNRGDLELCTNIYENLIEAGIEEQGVDYANTVLTASASSGEDLYYVGKMAYLTGDYAIAVTQLAAAADKGYDQALLLLGCVYAEEEETELAKETFASYMALYPDDPDALLALGKMALTAGAYEEAVSYLESARSALGDGFLAELYQSLVIAYEYSGDFVSAYEAAGVYLSYVEDADMEREYVFLETRVGETE